MTGDEIVRVEQFEIERLMGCTLSVALEISR